MLSHSSTIPNNLRQRIVRNCIVWNSRYIGTQASPPSYLFVHVYTVRTKNNKQVPSHAQPVHTAGDLRFVKSVWAVLRTYWGPWMLLILFFQITSYGTLQTYVWTARLLSRNTPQHILLEHLRRAAHTGSLCDSLRATPGHHQGPLNLQS